MSSAEAGVREGDQECGLQPQDQQQRLLLPLGVEERRRQQDSALQVHVDAPGRAFV